MTGNLDAVKKEAMRVEEDCIHSAKAYFNISERCKALHYWLGIPSAVFAAIASASAFNSMEQVAGCISILVAALASIITFVDPNAKAAIHKMAGDRFLKLRNEARRFHEIDLPQMGETDARAKIHKIAKEKDELSEESPVIPRWAFDKARKGIDSGEASYRADKGGRKCQS